MSSLRWTLTSRPPHPPSARGSRAQQREDRVAGRRSLVQHAMHGIDDRHVDRVLPAPTPARRASRRLLRRRGRSPRGSAPAAGRARAPVRRAGCATDCRCRSARDRRVLRVPSAFRAGRPAPATCGRISARPRVMSAARALSPKPSPSLAPAAIASTFLTAPPTSTPGRSLLGYARSASPRSNAATSRVSAASVVATTSAVGSPRATSSAKSDPKSRRPDAATPARSRDAAAPMARRFPAWRRIPSRPIRAARQCAARAMRRPAPSNSATGVAPISRSASTAAKSDVIVSVSGNGMPGR